MKRTIIVFISLLVMLIVVAGCTSEQKAPGPVQTTGTPMEVRPHYIIGVDADFPPFALKDSAGNISGFDIEAARWIAEKKGFDVEFVAVPWENAISMLEAGKIDIIASGMTITEKRLVLVNFSQPYYAVNMSIAARAGSNITMKDLYDGRLRIGAQTGTNEADWVNKTLIQTGKMPSSNLSLYPDITTLTNNLENRTFDVSIVQSPSQQRAIKGKSLVIIGTTPSQEKIAFAVRKTDSGLQAIINDGLLQLMKDPYWQQLKQKYGME